MSAKNDITGDLIKSRTNSKAFDNGWDLIWGNPVETPIEDLQHGSTTSDTVQGISSKIQPGNIIP